MHHLLRRVVLTDGLLSQHRCLARPIPPTLKQTRYEAGYTRAGNRWAFLQFRTSATTGCMPQHRHSKHVPNDATGYRTFCLYVW